MKLGAIPLRERRTEILSCWPLTVYILTVLLLYVITSFIFLYIFGVSCVLYFVFAPTVQVICYGTL